MVAANAVAVMVVNIGAIACRGFANATTIIVSQELGKDNIDAAREYGKRMLRITMVVSLIGCVIILALRPLILDFYRAGPFSLQIERLPVRSSEYIQFQNHSLSMDSLFSFPGR